MRKYVNGCEFSERKLVKPCLSISQKCLIAKLKPYISDNTLTIDGKTKYFNNKPPTFKCVPGTLALRALATLRSYHIALVAPLYEVKNHKKFAMINPKQCLLDYSILRYRGAITKWG